MNILILTAKFGMGHYNVAMSLKQDLENENTHVEVVDFFDMFFPRTKSIIYKIFNILVSKCSRIYNFSYRFSANTKYTLFDKTLKKKIDELIDQKDVDIIISTFPTCSKFISSYKRKNNKNISLHTYITDIDINKEWITNETDLYFVASNDTKTQAIEQGVPESKIKVVGIPVKKEFNCNTHLKDENEIIIMGGGLGLIPHMNKTLEDLSKIENIHITLLVGKNKKLYKKYYDKYKNITVVSYTNEVHKYMNKSQLIITKAGGITVFEAINSETPIYTIYPFLIHEKGNAKFIEKNEIGTVIWKKKESIAQDILTLLRDTKTIEKMKNNMQKIKENLETTNILDIYKERISSKC